LVKRLKMGCGIAFAVRPTAPSYAARRKRATHLELWARPAGQASSTIAPARRASIGELLGGPPVCSARLKAQLARRWHLPKHEECCHDVASRAQRIYQHHDLQADLDIGRPWPYLE
jgi:hypothetical protein